MDDGSSDRSNEIVAEYAARDQRIRLLHSSGQGKKAAIRQAMEICAEDYIACTDADCLPGRDWLSCIAAQFAATNSELIIAPVAIEDKFPLQALEFQSLQAVTAAYALSGRPIMCNGANMAYKKTAWLGARGELHNETASGDDMFLLQAVKKSGGRISYLYNRAATVYTRGADGAAAFMQQRGRWLSKSNKYRDKDVIFCGLVVFLASVVLILSLGFAFVNPGVLWVWAAKFLADFAILLPWAHFLKQTKVLFWIVALSLVYPFYALATAIYASIGNITWKKRRI